MLWQKIPFQHEHETSHTLLRDNLRALMSIPVASKKGQKIEFFHTPGQIRIQDTFKNYHEVRHAKQLVS